MAQEGRCSSCSSWSGVEGLCLAWDHHVGVHRFEGDLPDSMVDRLVIDAWVRRQVWRNPEDVVVVRDGFVVLEESLAAPETTRWDGTRCPYWVAAHDLKEQLGEIQNTSSCELHDKQG